MKASELQFHTSTISEIRGFVEKWHYSHSVNGVKISYCFKAVYEGRIVGAVVFGQMSTTAWKKFGGEEQDVLELRRLVLLDEAERNSESRFVGYCLRWLAKNSEVKVVVSYADPEHGHSGVIYRASNFEYLGRSGKDRGFFDTETGKTYHSRALRTKYKGDFKPFVKKLRARLAEGKLIPKDLEGKHCFIFKLKRNGTGKVPCPDCSKEKK